ncbi:hypothetical protein [Pedobacter sp. AJM]|uniref:hypothetical protein n=1 Tax=Pedobacter sp. AJM TaxID=2003629 RepID=UPI000B4B9EFE|nr:hypothetical protein [Pedobacter sp. AJM]OWK72186.1 hypothetical protein CBW18_00985 [Pedobacter sp. AJM]
MSDKFVKALFRQHKHPMKNLVLVLPWVVVVCKIVVEALIVFSNPSFPRPGSRDGDSEAQS